MNEPAEKLEPKVGEIVNIKYPNQSGYLTIFFSKNEVTGINTEGNLYINSLIVYPSTPFSLPSEEDKTRLLTALSDAGYRYNEETHEVEKIGWKPKVREKYWSFRAAGVYNRINTLSDIDLFVINNNFAFQTETEAQEFFDKIRQLANENR